MADVLRKAIAGSTYAVLDLVDAVEQPSYFEDGDEVVPTGKPADGPLGKRPPSKGVDTTKNIYPETKDPDSGDAVAHVEQGSVEDAPTYKSPDEVAVSASTIAKSLVSKGKGIADDIRETMDDLGGALHELREVEEALVARQERARNQASEMDDAREISAAAVR